MSGGIPVFTEELLFSLHHLGLWLDTSILIHASPVLGGGPFCAGHRYTLAGCPLPVCLEGAGLCPPHTLVGGMGMQVAVGMQGS